MEVVEIPCLIFFWRSLKNSAFCTTLSLSTYPRNKSYKKLNRQSRKPKSSTYDSSKAGYRWRAAAKRGCSCAANSFVCLPCSCPASKRGNSVRQLIVYSAVYSVYKLISQKMANFVTALWEPQILHVILAVHLTTYSEPSLVKINFTLLVKKSTPETIRSFATWKQEDTAVS
jgi:hypothetical protein